MTAQAQPVDAQRLVDAYAKAVRRLTAADDALQAAAHPVDQRLVFEHHYALEDFHTIRGILTTSIKTSNAFLAVDGFRP